MVVPSGHQQQPQITAMVLPQSNAGHIQPSSVMLPPQTLTIMTSASKREKENVSKLPISPPRRRGGKRKKNPKKIRTFSPKKKKKEQSSNSNFDENVKNHKMNPEEEEIIYNSINESINNSINESDYEEEEEDGVPPPPPYIEVYTKKGNIFQDMIDTSGQNKSDGGKNDSKIPDFL